MMAVPYFSCSSTMSSRIWAWIVTSRAVVGSSAIRTLGLQERPIAIMARWRMPRENWWGYSLALLSGLAMPTSRSTCTVFSWASLLERFWWMRIASRIWLPTVKTGFRLVMGSWKIMAMSLPLISCIRLSGVLSRSWPSKRISPSGYSVGGLGLSCMMERAVTLLPLPDSPTIPRVSPASSENETPSTALTTPSWVLKCVMRLFTSSIATGYSSLSEWPLSARTEGYSSGFPRARAVSSPLLLLHVLQDRPVEIAALLLALLEILGADGCTCSGRQRARDHEFSATCSS